MCNNTGSRVGVVTSTPSGAISIRVDTLVYVLNHWFVTGLLLVIGLVYAGWRRSGRWCEVLHRRLLDQSGVG